MPRLSTTPCALQCSRRRSPWSRTSGDGAAAGECDSSAQSNRRPVKRAITKRKPAMNGRRKSRSTSKNCSRTAPGRLPNLATLQVIAHDPQTGEPVGETRYAYGQGRVRSSRVAGTTRRYPMSSRRSKPTSAAPMASCATSSARGWAIFLIAWEIGSLGGWHLAAEHPSDRPGTQSTSICCPQARNPANCRREDSWATACSAANPMGSSTTGLIHSRVDVADLNGDGLFDLIVGCSRGGVVWYPNRGKRGQPEFPFSQLVVSDGKPLDVGLGLGSARSGLGRRLAAGSGSRRRAKPTACGIANTGSKSRRGFNMPDWCRPRMGSPLMLPGRTRARRTGRFQARLLSGRDDGRLGRRRRYAICWPVDTLRAGSISTRTPRRADECRSCNSPGRSRPTAGRSTCVGRGAGRRPTWTTTATWTW